MKLFCPITKDECRDDCALSLPGIALPDTPNELTDEGYWCAIAHAGVALVNIAEHAKEVSGQSASLLVTLDGGSINTYEQNA